MTVTYDAENKLVELIADCPKGATGVKAYKDGKYLGLGYIVGDKITKKFSNITKKEARTEHVYTFGLNALFGQIESEIATLEFVVPEMSIDPYVLGTSNITGTYKGDVDKAKLYINDAYADVYGGTFKDGSFTFYAKNRFTISDKVELEGMSKAGKVSVIKQLVEVVSNLELKDDEDAIDS